MVGVYDSKKAQCGRLTIRSSRSDPICSGSSTMCDAARSSRRRRHPVRSVDPVGLARLSSEPQRTPSETVHSIAGTSHA
jgi:hypothetical protein